MTGMYSAKSRMVKAVQYDGTNKEEIEAFVPASAASFERPYRSLELIMRRISPPAPWVMVVHPGDWVSWDGSFAGLHSDDSFHAAWEPAE